MAGIEELRKRQEEWKLKRPSGGSDSLWFRSGDVAVLHFIGTGNEGDPYMEVYLAHEVPSAEPGGFPTLVYCPKASGHDLDYACQYCEDGTKLKERMAIWFWVYDMLHSQLRDPSQSDGLDIVTFEGRQYFRRQVNGPKRWETSAWRDSPLGDIFAMHSQMGNLRSWRMTLRAVGEKLDRRYKIMIDPNGNQPLSEENLKQAQEQCEPIVEWLRKSLDAPVEIARPAAPQQSETPQVPIKPYNVSDFAPPPGTPDMKKMF